MQVHTKSNHLLVIEIRNRPRVVSFWFADLGKTFDFIDANVNLRRPKHTGPKTRIIFYKAKFICPRSGARTTADFGKVKNRLAVGGTYST